MTSTEQLEREAELSRNQLAVSLNELRSITPGRIMDEILGYAKSGSAELLRGLGNQVVEHPLPATLIGAGLAWMIMSSGSSGRGTAHDTRSRTSSNGGWFSETRQAASSAADSAGERASSAMHGLKDSAQNAMGGIGDSIGSATGAARDRAQSTMSSLSDTAASIGDSLSSAYGVVSGSVASAADSVIPSQDELMQASQRIWDFCKDQPLVVAGLGLAIGAALGAAIPETGAEHRLMGEASDQLKQKAQDFVTDPLKHANQMAKSVGEQIIDEAARIAKQEVANLVSGWGSGARHDGGVPSDEPSGGDPSSESFSSGQGQRPYH